MPYASGVAVHDFWKPYQKYDNVDYAYAARTANSAS